MAHIAQYKKRIVHDLVKLFRSYPIIGCLDMENLPAQQLQQMKAELRGKVEMAMTKRRLIKIAIDNCKEVKGIEKIKDYLSGMPALLFTKEDPFKLSKILQKSKTSAPAKAGQIAPKDIMINAGPTPFAPGPIIGELALLGLKTGVEANKVVIKEDKIVVKKGEIVKQEVASVLSRLDVKPMEIGLNLIAVLESGEIIPKEVLTVNEEEYLQKLQLAHNFAFNLSIEAGIFNKDNIKFLLGKAFNHAKAIAFENNIISTVVVEEMLSNAERVALNIKEQGNIEVVEKVEEEKEEMSETQRVSEHAQKSSEKISDIVEEEKKEEVKEEIKEEPVEKVEIKHEKPAIHDEGYKDTGAKVAKMVKQMKDKVHGKDKAAEDILREVDEVEESKKIRDEAMEKEKKRGFKL